MASDVNTYIEELRAELAGADPAVIQDALYDAEEYLRSELAAPSAPAGDQDPNPTEALAAVIERYGTPREVAAAYLHAGTESTGGSGPTAASGAPAGAALPASPTPKAQWRPIDFFTVMADPRTWTSFAYMLLSLATGIIYFTVVVTGISLSAGLSVLVIGVPFALLFLALVRALSLAEGRIVEVLLGVRMPRRPRLGPSDGGVWQRVLFWLKDRRTWTTMLYMGLQLPLGITYFTVTITGVATGLSMIALPFVQLFTGHSYVEFGGGTEYLFRDWQMPLLVIGGALLTLATLNLVRLTGWAHGAYAKAMLVRAGGTT